MKVKNYIVEDSLLFMEYLERELCQQGISYVKIDNEIHFQNQIVRLYDFERDYGEMVKYFFIKLEQEKEKLLNNPLLIIPEEDSYKELLTKREKCYSKRNRSTLKRESIEGNQKLKKYNKKRKI